jgi:hypothetical protein
MFNFMLPHDMYKVSALSRYLTETQEATTANIPGMFCIILTATKMWLAMAILLA